MKHYIQSLQTTGILVLFFLHSLSGQTLELGVGGGVSAYNGDILPETFLFPKTSGFAGQVQLSLHLNERWRAQLFYNRGRLMGSDTDFDTVDRNLSFTTDINEVGLRGFFNFIPFDTYGETGSPFTLYVGTGISVYHFNPFTTNFQGQKVFLQEIGTAGQYLPEEAGHPSPYNLLQLGVPVTGGVSYAITPNVILSLEVDYRVIFTDYIDDIANDRNPIFDDLLLSSEQAALLSNRAWELEYDPDQGQNPIDVARMYYQNRNLASGYRSVGTKNDVFGFILFRVSYLLDGFSLGRKSGFGCYKF